MQGKILGMSQSMQSLAMAMSPIIGGVVARYFIEFPFLVASLASLIGVIIYLKEKSYLMKGGRYQVYIVPVLLVAN